jgi:hypothetical protein
MARMDITVGEDGVFVKGDGEIAQVVDGAA